MVGGIFSIIGRKNEAADAVIQSSDAFDCNAKTPLASLIEQLFGMILRAEPGSDQQLAKPERNIVRRDPHERT
jgi:hypothetical protein